MEQFIDFVNNNTWIYLIPTILLVLIILLSILIGLKRGFVKSMHKFIIVLVSLSICIGLFYLFIINDGAIFYKVSSTILGWFNLSYADLTKFEPLEPNMKGVVFPVVVDYVSNNLGGPEQMALEVYYQLQVWTQIAYKTIAALACFIIYLLLWLIANIIDSIFFGKRKRVRKCKKAGARYNNRSFLGGTVGFFRGILASLIIFSFFGVAVTSVSASSRADSELSFNDSQINDIYDLSKFSDKLGDSGLFKLLNNIKDKDNMPFYLFFANQIFSGEAIDYNGNKYTVYAAKEFGSISTLAKDLMHLLAKHGGEEISLEVLNSDNNEDIIKLYTDLFNKEEFNNDLMNLIDKYQSTQYIINLVKISIATLNKYFDDIMYKLDPENANEYISIYNSIFSTEDDPYYIAVQDIATYEDSKLLLKALVASIPTALDMANYQINNAGQKGFEINVANRNFKIVQAMNPYIEKLSMFNEGSNVEAKRDLNITKVDRINKLYDRVFKLTFSIFKDENGQPLPYPYEGKDIKWNRELLTCSESFNNLVELTDEMLKHEDLTSIQMINLVFDNNYENKEVIDKAYYDLADKYSSYDSVRYLLESDIFYSMYEEMLSSMTKTEVALPHNIIWNNEGDNKGELYKFLDILRTIVGEGTLDPIANDPNMQDLNTFRAVLEQLNKPYQGTTILEYMFESTLLYYSSSVLLSNLNVDFLNIYVPLQDRVLIEDVLMVNKTSLVQSISPLLDILLEIEDLEVLKDDPFILTDIISKEKNKDKIISSSILTASFSNTLYSMSKTNPNLQEFIYIPEALSLEEAEIDSNIEYWLGSDGELDNILKAFAVVDVRSLADNNNKAIYDLLQLPEGDFNTLISSNTMHFTVARYINDFDMEAMPLFVPIEVQTHTCENETTISSTELYSLFNSISLIVNYDEENDELKYDLDVIVNKRHEVLTSNILYATVANYLTRSETTKELLIPSHLKNVDINYISESVWRKNFEIENVLKSLEILDIKLSNLTESGFDTTSISKQVLSLDKLVSADNEEKTKLSHLYDSSIISYTLSDYLLNNESTKDTLIIPEIAISCLNEDPTELIINEIDLLELITGVKVGFNLNEEDDLFNSFEDINSLISKLFNTSKDEFENKKLYIIKSYILEETLITNVNKNLDTQDNIIIPLFLSNDNYNEWRAIRNDRDVINHAELGKLLDVFYITELGKNFGSDKFASLVEEKLSLQNIIVNKNDNAENINDKKELQNTLLSSYIIKSTIIKTLIETESLHKPKGLLLTDLRAELVKDSLWYKEVTSLFTAINELKLNIEGNSLQFNANELINELTDSSIDNICDSFTLYLTLSNNIINESQAKLKITDNILSDLYEESVISNSELKALVKGLQALDLDFNSDLVVPSQAQLEVALNSEILKVNISYQILNQATVSTDNLDDNQYNTYNILTYSDKVEISTESINVLNEEIINDFVILLNEFSDDNSSFTIKFTSVEQIAELNDSYFNSVIVISIINDTILGNDSFKLAFKTLYKLATNTEYSFTATECLEISNYKINKVNKEFITRADLLKIKK